MFNCGCFLRTKTYKNEPKKTVLFYFLFWTKDLQQCLYIVGQLCLQPALYRWRDSRFTKQSLLRSFHSLQVISSEPKMVMAKWNYRIYRDLGICCQGIIIMQIIDTKQYSFNYKCKCANIECYIYEILVLWLTR